ncbi:MAG: hypothetical protein ISQ34_03565 [Rickettsiales bacterium]|nr:hypothetical protein [Rickettsiales bacterium]
MQNILLNDEYKNNDDLIKIDIDGLQQIKEKLLNFAKENNELLIILNKQSCDSLIDVQLENITEILKLGFDVVEKTKDMCLICQSYLFEGNDDLFKDFMYMVDNIADLKLLNNDFTDEVRKLKESRNVNQELAIELTNIQKKLDHFCEHNYFDEEYITECWISDGWN